MTLPLLGLELRLASPLAHPHRRQGTDSLFLVIKGLFVQDADEDQGN